MMWPMHHPCSAPMPGCCVAPPGWIYHPVYVPVTCPPPMPEHRETECRCEELRLPQQIDANGDKKSDALVGGHDDAHPTLEYLVETGAADTTVTVTALRADGTASTWTDSGAGVGFHVQEGFLAVKPGTKLTLEVKDIKVTARLRWCESICC